MSTATANWYDDFPAPIAKPETITAEELHTKFINGKQSEKDFLVVDVRRTDFDNGLIVGAINLPAHSFYQTLPALMPILTEYKQVIFHCQSSSGRGPRCAGWYADELSKIGNEDSKSVVLVGGIKNWCKLYKEEKDLTIILPAQA